MRKMKIYLVFFLLFVSTGLTVRYSFRLFCFVLCGDFNFSPSYSMVETSFNVWYNWSVDYIYFWWCCSYVFDFFYSFCDMFTLLIKISYFICAVYRWLNWL